jgi:biopolymer transport protein ExbD
MASRRRKRTEDDVGFQLAPMIDMTFLLLIFFMLTSTVTNLKVKQDVKVPLAPSAVIPKDASQRLLINIDAKGGLFLGDQPITEKALASELNRQFKDNPPLQLYVRADRAVEAKRIKAVVRLATEAGAVKVILATVKK